jgi:hypothetical protein
MKEISVKGVAFDRLCDAGATSTQAMQARIRAFAHERGLPPEEIHKLMYKRVATGHILDFCRKYKVNCDWLLYGDLRGLRLMATGQQPIQRPRYGLADKLKRLTPDQLAFMETVVDQLLAQQNLQPPA